MPFATGDTRRARRSERAAVARALLAHTVMHRVAVVVLVWTLPGCAETLYLDAPVAHVVPIARATPSRTFALAPSFDAEAPDSYECRGHICVRGLRAQMERGIAETLGAPDASSAGDGSWRVTLDRVSFWAIPDAFSVSRVTGYRRIPHYLATIRRYALYLDWSVSIYDAGTGERVLRLARSEKSHIPGYEPVASGLERLEEHALAHLGATLASSRLASP